MNCFRAAHIFLLHHLTSDFNCDNMFRSTRFACISLLRAAPTKGYLEPSICIPSKCLFVNVSTHGCSTVFASLSNSPSSMSQARCSTAIALWVFVILQSMQLMSPTRCLVKASSKHLQSSLVIPRLYHALSIIIIIIIIINHHHHHHHQSSSSSSPSSS